MRLTYKTVEYMGMYKSADIRWSEPSFAQIVMPMAYDGMEDVKRYLVDSSIMDAHGVWSFNDVSVSDISTRIEGSPAFAVLRDILEDVGNPDFTLFDYREKNHNDYVIVETDFGVGEFSGSTPFMMDKLLDFYSLISSGKSYLYHPYEVIPILEDNMKKSPDNTEYIETYNLLTSMPTNYHLVLLHM